VLQTSRDASGVVTNSIYFSGGSPGQAQLCSVGESGPPAEVLQPVQSPISYFGIGVIGSVSPWGAVPPGVVKVTVTIGGPPCAAETRTYLASAHTVTDYSDPLMPTAAGWRVFHDIWIAMPRQKFSVTAAAFDAAGRKLGERTITAP